jgi:hypothetical protein
LVVQVNRGTRLLETEWPVDWTEQETLLGLSA